ncbi:MAG: sigma-70 family RNA polymerase sigma factor [Gammaproteobacteria bacterium]|nr:sigma-70 family RNA polymerase sigma factor [Gammaproteobacteria bacterium]MDE2250376.1 sigma-70 family RNA polymerase sigma factor [Gammaproteobacteria bacterium]
MSTASRNSRFSAEVLPHGGAAYNLARWLSRNETDARDIVQESLARALQYFEGFRGGDARSWLLRIVRNTASTWLVSRPPAAHPDQSEADEPLEPAPGSGAMRDADPLGALISQDQARVLRQAIAQLPLEYREVLVLREFEDLAYRQIAAIVGCPIGTVMSRLARARDELGARMRAEAQSS